MAQAQQPSAKRRTQAQEQPPAKRIRLNEVVDNLKSILQCPVCYKTPKKTETLGVCTNGHIICEECLPKVSTCPLCRARFQKQCPTILQQVLSVLPEMFQTCQNIEHGCQETFSDENELNCHEGKCEFRIVDCIDHSCDEEVTFGSMLTHIKETHDADLITGNAIGIVFTKYGFFDDDFDDDYVKNWYPRYFHFDNNTFAVNFCCCKEGDKELYYVMCLLLSGGEQDAKNYIFQITVRNDMDKRYKIHYSGDVIPLDEPSEERYFHPGCLSFSKAMANRVMHPVTNEIELKIILQKL